MLKLPPDRLECPKTKLGSVDFVRDLPQRLPKLRGFLCSQSRESGIAVPAPLSGHPSRLGVS